jgi:hypothetical protein
MLCRYLLGKTQIPSTAADLTSLESCTEGPLRNLTLTGFPWTTPETCPYNIYAVTTGWIFLFSCSLRTADWFQACILFNFSFFIYTITCKYRWLLLLFSALNAQILPWNNAVGKGMKQSCDDNWICFNSVTKFCSRFVFTVQFKWLL